jgi:glycosyltransferase involved in cell wall biosynthesis
LQIMLLDRGDSPSIGGIETIEFPSYTCSDRTTAAADSLLIDQFCHELGVDVFTSTYYTTPASVPSVLMVYDMIPEILEFDLSRRVWQEKQIAISFASYYACISENTRTDLLRIYSAICGERAVATRCGVERGTFRPRTPAEVENFKGERGISRAYYLAVGSREQHLGYKNAALLFRAARGIRDAIFEIVCVGGEAEISGELLDGLSANVSVRRVSLSDGELACAYSGAEALVYPSLYEGFGMPVIEAMACGCPVITTRFGSLGEVAGDAAVFISGRDEGELRRAMAIVREPARRKQLIDRGLRQAGLFDWDAMARGFYDLLKKAAQEGESSAMKEFFREWKRLRTIQADVDPG